MKKVIIIVVTILVIAALGIVGYFVVLPKISGNNNSGSVVYVENVGELLSGFAFTENRYNAVVETQETVAIEADADKKIKKTYVSEGDKVKKGDKLFEYDIEEMKITLEQYRLDIEQAESSIKADNEQIASLEKERKTASANQQLNLTNQIEALKLEIKKSEYTKASTEKSIEKLEKSIENAVVTSTTDGSILSVNDPNAKGYVMITSSGDYRVKVIVNEMNISALSEGDDMIVRSRVDNTLEWRGVISKIDTAHPITNTQNRQNSMYGGMNGSEESTTTKYPVYIDLVSSDGLMVGQHVTAEVDTGVSEEDEEGLWLYDYYICDADSSPYVWAESSSHTLEKRSVVLGEYNENTYKYEIKSGLSEDDSIAFPEERFTEGMPVTHNIEEASFEGDAAGEDGMIITEGMPVTHNIEEASFEDYSFEGDAAGEDIMIMDEGVPMEEEIPADEQ